MLFPVGGLEKSLFWCRQLLLEPAIEKIEVLHSKVSFLGVLVDEIAVYVVSNGISRLISILALGKNN
jgi:hypothetical protein